MRIFIIRFLIYKWISYKSFWINLISIYYNLIKYIHFLLWYGLVFVLLSFIYTYKYSATSIGAKASNPFKRLIQFLTLHSFAFFHKTLSLFFSLSLSLSLALYILLIHTQKQIIFLAPILSLLK